ncbi:MAG TPA: hypothetical protein VHZ07_26065 [Bryobacteraceae bacterium]|jgi:hypothetical protein|nr:hypothetical protein [Bryobacteraceae bacterium]
MTRKKFWGASFALGFALISLPQVTPILRAQSQAQAPAQQDQQKSGTLVGKVIKAKNGQYALLTDEQAGKGVYLDDPDKVKPFEGKTVKVTGILDMAKNLFHVTDIQAV